MTSCIFGFIFTTTTARFCMRLAAIESSSKGLMSAEGIEPWRTKRVALTLCHLGIYCSTANDVRVSTSKTSQEQLPMQLKRVFLVLLLFVSPAFAQWHPQKSNTDA